MQSASSPTFGKLLRRYRLEAGLSQEQLAQRAGLSARGISDLERELRRVPRRATVDQLGEALGLDHAQLERLVSVASPARRRSTGMEVGARPFRLPAFLTSFIGRERAVAEVRELVQSNRLVTISGPPGIGKTRLALQLVSGLREAHAGGVALVELASVAELGLVEHAVAAALGVQERPGRTPSEAIAEQVADHAVLLVLDNCEHLIDACAQLVAFLLANCADLRILTTSRQSLGIIGETTYRLAPLELPAERDDLSRITGREAVRLLIDRARAVQPGFKVTASNAAAVARVCRRLDGIPLAIELTAAWVRVLGVDQVAARLEDRFGLLTSGNRSAPERHQTLRNAIEWSYDLLAGSEGRLFNRLAVFAGGWTLEAAESVVADEGSESPEQAPEAGSVESPDVLGLLATLVDKSLVLFEDTPEAGRYRMLETLRQFAAERLAASGEDARVRERHRLWCADLAERGEREIWRADQVRWVRLLARDQDNLRAALRWTLSGADDADPGLRIGAALGRFWDTRGDPREGIGWLRDLLALPTVLTRTPGWGRAMTALGYLKSLDGNSDEAVAILDESLRYWRDLGEPRALAVALFFRGIAVGFPRFDEAALPFFQQSLELSRVRGPRWTTYFSLLSLGEAARALGDYARAQALLDEALSLVEIEGERHGAFFVFNSLALLALVRGDVRKAQACGVQSLTAALELDNRQGIVMSLDTLASVAAAAARHRRAARLFGAADAARAIIGDFAYATARPDRQRGMAAARAGLGDADFEQEWSAGGTLTLEQAATEAQLREPAPTDRVTPLPARRPSLTPREMEVLHLAAEGVTNHEIAERLIIGEATVKRHMENVFAKLGVASRTAAVTAAMRSGLM
ncbi:MAG TPA: LuxR C-terminal-related transcriptional regulator [Chloroflexota bacterium]